MGETGCSSVVERHAGHIAALRANGLPLRTTLTVLRRYEPLPAGQRAALLSELLDGPERPTVLLCANGYVLAAAYDLLGPGLRVPEDIDLACMDDAGPYGTLRLAVVAGVLPSERMARKAMDLLTRRMTSTRPYRGQTRGSCSRSSCGNASRPAGTRSPGWAAEALGRRAGCRWRPGPTELRCRARRVRARGRRGS